MLSKYIIPGGKQRSDLKALLSHTLTHNTHNHFSTPVFTPIKISVSLVHATNIVSHVCLFSVEIISLSLYPPISSMCMYASKLYTAQTRGLVPRYPSSMTVQKMITCFHISNHFILIGADDFFLRFNSLRHLHRFLLRDKIERKCIYNQRQKVLFFMIFSFCR